MLEPAYCLFVCDEDDWCAQGRYESIINCTPTAEDYINWTKDENYKWVIRIVGVSVLILLFYIFSFKRKNIRQLSIQVLHFISQGLLAIAPVLALNQSLVHIQILMLQPVMLSKVLQILLYSLAVTCLPLCTIV